MAADLQMNPSPAPAEALWPDVVRDFRQCCVLRQQAHPAEARRVAENTLTGSILAWADRDLATGAAQTLRLEAMFQHERQRVEDVWLAHEWLQQRWRTELLPALATQIAVEVRQAVAALTAAQPAAPPAFHPRPEPTAGRPARALAGDIPSIIDLLLEQERQAAPCPLAA